jgi:hypothetical protein
VKKDSNAPFTIESISEQHRLLGMAGPHHPLVSVINFDDVKTVAINEPVRFSMGFYSITIKQGCKCKVKYGQHYYDFDQGVMSFFAPGQVFTWEVNDSAPTAGWLLVFHPDFIRQYPLGQKIKEYGFFEYGLTEALHLSTAEEATLEAILTNIRRECAGAIDSYSQEVAIAYLDLLLTYANRFYNRQFITRKHV